MKFIFPINPRGLMFVCWSVDWSIRRSFIISQGWEDTLQCFFRRTCFVLYLGDCSNALVRELLHFGLGQVHARQGGSQLKHQKFRYKFGSSVDIFPNYPTFHILTFLYATLAVWSRNCWSFSLLCNCPYKGQIKLCNDYLRNVFIKDEALDFFRHLIDQMLQNNSFLKDIRTLIQE